MNISIFITHIEILIEYFKSNLSVQFILLYIYYCLYLYTNLIILHFY